MLAVDPLILFDNSTSLAILGISWRPHNDKFCFEIDVQPLSSVVTKRSILSSIARIFDPMGWLSPIVISVKILLQSLWLLKVGWDDALPDHIVSLWKSWQEQSYTLSSIQLPRWSCYSPQTQVVEIHGFADASRDAYAAVIYLRVVQNSEVFVSLQIPKTHVAPIKTLSIPRLELCAAHTRSFSKTLYQRWCLLCTIVFIFGQTRLIFSVGWKIAPLDGQSSSLIAVRKFSLSCPVPSGIRCVLEKIPPT